MNKVLLSIFASIAIVFSPITLANPCTLEIIEIAAIKTGIVKVLFRGDSNYYQLEGNAQVELSRMALPLNIKICMKNDGLNVTEIKLVKDG